LPAGLSTHRAAQRGPRFHQRARQEWFADHAASQPHLYDEFSLPAIWGCAGVFRHPVSILRPQKSEGIYTIRLGKTVRCISVNRLTTDINIDNIITNKNYTRCLAAMEKNLMEVIMNPTRQRIIQYLVIHGQGSTGEMRREIQDIPPASLYRHVKLLLDAGLLEVVKEERIRGVVERTYRIANKEKDEIGLTDIGAIIQTGLLSLMSVFQEYFSREDRDPVKDLLSFSTSTLMMTDEEFLSFLMKLNAIFGEAIKNKPGDGRKPRRLTLISSPNEEDMKSRE
jgi:DNA-binding transcriptional ArsR family regulator